MAAGDTTVDELMGGRIRLIQPKTGYRVSMDTLMLAASVPAGPGETVLEAGSGTGGAALCLAVRCPEAKVWGLEIQPAMAALAQQNIQLNRLEGRARFVTGCITDPPGELIRESFDHVMANPPYMERGEAVRPPAPSKGDAYVESTATLEDWIKFCITMARPKGTVTFIYRADRIDALMAGLYRRAGEAVICPLWPKRGQIAKRVLIQARKGLHGAATLLPGIAMHDESGNDTEEARTVLREAGAIDLAPYRFRA